MLNRLDPATYANDEPVGIAAAPKSELPGPIADARWRYIPERLWHRILHLGSAYELHFAAVMEPQIDTVIDSTQCEAFEDEFRFLVAILDDAATKSALATILDELTTVRGRRDMALVISPP